jgi:hypothetical protein
LEDTFSIKKKIFNYRLKLAEVLGSLKETFKSKSSYISSEMVGWLAIMFIHSATIPSILGLIFAISDNLPSLDVVFFIWFGLFLFFIKALLNKDTLNIVTIGFGFFIQAVLLGMVVFK